MLVSLSAHAADWQGHARLWLGPGYDSNARREFVSPGVATQNDAFFFALAQLDGSVTFAERFRVVGAYDGAARKFVLAPTEDTIVQSAQLEGTVALGDYFALGVAGRARDRRGAQRDYTDLQGGAVIDFFPDPAIDVRAFINAHRFLFYNRFAYSFSGPDGGFQARFRFLKRHSVSLNGGFNPRVYNSEARTPPDANGNTGTTGSRRRDTVFSVGATYAYRGPFHFSFTYGYYDQTSNSFGETVRRHRLSALAGFRLPWKLTLLATLTFQPSLFPDGVYLSQDLTVVEDDENMSSATLKLVRPLTKWLDVDVRYAGFIGFFPQNSFLYMRHVVSVGLSVSF